MGGCRCSYRTCKAISDGNTHFFHYPVFDKHRCHQWIANAQRFDLLELKLSQLKNRVICQNHFQDNMFMNDKRNKLTHNAVPTLDGPLVAVKSLPQDPPIVPTDISVSNTLQEIVRNKGKIEDDTKYFTSREKIATFSVPYSEFLKKCDLDQLNDPDLLKSMQTPRKKQPHYTSRLIVTEPQTTVSTQDCVDVPTRPPSQRGKSAEGKKQKNVIILSEKKISNKVPIKPSPGDLKKVAPNFVIKKPKKEVSQPQYASPAATAAVLPNELPRNTNSSEDNIIIPDCYPQNPADVSLTLQTPTHRAMPAQQTLQIPSEDSNKYLPQIVSVNSIPSAANNCVVHPTVLDVEFVPEVARVPLEHAPVIATPQKPAKSQKEEKDAVSTSAEKINTEDNVQYSSRLREVVEKALSRLDEQRRKQLVSKSPHHVHRHQPSPVSFKSRHICKNPKKPNSLTAALLSKVKENSRDIAEIKHLLQEQVKSANDKSVKTVKDKSVEVPSNSEKRKKYLFKEISQYLSTKLKSDLYEELFINHLVPKTRSSSTRRKTSPKFT